MSNNLYLVRGSRFVSADPVRGRMESATEYSRYFVTIGKSEDLAVNKVLYHLRENTRSRDWEKCDVKELSACTDVPLEKRVEILRQCFSFVE